MRRLLMVLLAAATALAIAAVPAQAVFKKKAIWGPVKLPGGQSAFPVYDELGVDVLQVVVDWSKVAPTEPARATSRTPGDPAYRWPAEVDFAVREAERHDMEVALMLIFTPGWANGGKPREFAPDEDVDFARFAQAASRRYPSVRFWMIWGEPNLENRFEPMPANSPVGPRRYADLLDAAYVSLKRHSRRNRIIGGMTWTAGVVRPKYFIEDLERSNGRPPRMDFYGHNPFGLRFPDLRNKPAAPATRDMSDVDSLYRDVRRQYKGSYFQYRKDTPRLWLSEYTVSSDRNDRAFGFHVDREEQAVWLDQAYRILDDNDYIYTVGWFNLIDEPVSVEGGLTTGLMTHEGERKPSFEAYRNAKVESD
jgi:hypothetical protein